MKPRWKIEINSHLYVVVLLLRDVLPLLGEVEQKELPDDGGDAKEGQTVANVEDGVAEGELARHPVHGHHEPDFN